MATLIQEIGAAPRARGLAATLARWRRILVRSLGFGSFGLVSTSLGFVILPLERVAARWRGAPEHAEIRAQYAIHRAMYGWIRWLQWLGLARVSVRGAEALRARPIVVVANHPSLIDTPVLLSLIPQADFIVNEAWGNHAFLRRCVEGAGYLRAERGAVMVRDAILRLRAGRNLMIYPEGSRTPPEGLRPFERGAALIALRAGCDIVPVVIRVRPRTLMKDQPFSDVPDRCPEWQVEVGEAIRPADYRCEGDGNSAAARRITAVLQDYFDKRWDCGNS